MIQQYKGKTEMTILEKISKQKQEIERKKAELEKKKKLLEQQFKNEERKYINKQKFALGDAIYTALKAGKGSEKTLDYLIEHSQEKNKQYIIALFDLLQLRLEEPESKVASNDKNKCQPLSEKNRTPNNL